MAKRNKYTAIPRNNDSKAIGSLTQIAETLTGAKGDKLEKAVTYRELRELGLLTSTFNGGNLRFALRDDIGGGNIGGTPLDPLENPDIPTNFQAVAGFQTVSLSWDFPDYGGHSVTQIWRNSVDTLGDMQAPQEAGEAVLVATVAGSLYVDSVNFDTEYYYWIRFVNRNNIPGPVNATAGTYVKTLKDITQVIDELENYIDSEIDTLNNGFNDALLLANNAIDDAEDRIGNVEDDITNRINGILTQATGDIGDLEIAQQGFSNNLSNNYYNITETNNQINGLIDTFRTTYVDANFVSNSFIADNYYTQAGTNSAITGRLSTFQSTVLTPNYKTTAQINTDHYTRSQANDAISSSVNSLKSQIFNADGTTVSSAFINQVRISQSDLNGAIATGVNNYSVSYGGQTYSIDEITQVSVDADNTYQAQWGVQTTVGALNFGIGFLNNNGTTTFAVSADNFAVYNPSNNALSLAFAVVDGEIVARKAVIGSAQIRSLMIQEQSVFEGNVLVNTRLTGARIHGAQISAGQLWVRSGSNAIAFSPSGSFLMWLGSNSFFNPDSGVDTRSLSNAKFAIDANGNITARGINIYNSNGDLILAANGTLNGAFINNLSVGTLDIQGNAVSVPVYMQQPRVVANSGWKTMLDQTINQGGGTVFAAFNVLTQRIGDESNLFDSVDLRMQFYSGATLEETVLFEKIDADRPNNADAQHLLPISGAALISGSSFRIVVQGKSRNVSFQDYYFSCKGFSTLAKR